MRRRITRHEADRLTAPHPTPPTVTDPHEALAAQLDREAAEHRPRHTPPDPEHATDLAASADRWTAETNRVRHTIRTLACADRDATEVERRLRGELCKLDQAANFAFALGMMADMERDRVVASDAAVWEAERIVADPPHD